MTRASLYCRVSTEEQVEGYSLDAQRRAFQTLVQARGWTVYKEYCEEGRSAHTDDVRRRPVFRQAIDEALSGEYDVLVVHKIDRFSRRLRITLEYFDKLGKAGVGFVSIENQIDYTTPHGKFMLVMQGGLAELYSDNLSHEVKKGLAEKAAQGLANGIPPLGYRSEKLDNGKRERKVPDLDGRGGNPRHGGMEALLALLRGYASGEHSYQTLADRLNAQGYRNRQEEPFTKGSVEHVVSNRFYIGQAVYHPGEPDEQARQGGHEVPPEVKELWLKCQELKRQRTRHRVGRPRSLRRAYPFAMVARCAGCGQPYGGQPVHRDNGEVVRRLYHRRPFCSLTPHSVRVEHVMAQFAEGVLPYVALDNAWRNTVIQALEREVPHNNTEEERGRLERALANLRKQHQWSDISDEEYRQERQAIDRRLKALEPSPTLIRLSNLERAAQLLRELPTLWGHPGVNDNQREELVKECFEEVHMRGRELVAIIPNTQYQPLFAYMATEGVRKCRGEWT
ncbi:MAG: recombinase family protein [Dehalococcoidia bacterium]|nr:recombinase family protein [Dehalococcoidia bacterium]